MRTTSLAVSCVAFAALLASSTLAQQNTAKPSTSTDAITAIIEAFGTHSVVALGEGDHNNEQGHGFRMALLRDARFAGLVNDIVVEFGNAFYQSVIDWFVSGGDVPSSELRKVWQNTSQLQPVWDVPIYEEFFRAVRAVNASVPIDHRIRVLLGDPPIDWSRVTTFKDVFSQMREAGDRDTHPARLIQGEVLTQGRRALVVYGDMHLGRTPANLRPGCQAGSTIPCFPGSIVDQLEATSGTHAFTITTVTGIDLRTLQADVTNWQPPKLAILRGTVLGATPYRRFLPPGPLVIGPDGQPQPESPTIQRPIEGVFDAVLYLGPPSTITYSRLSPELCADSTYVSMRRQRMGLGVGLQGLSICDR
jgi:hypothetical protein